MASIDPAFARLLLAKHADLPLEVKVVGIATQSRGTVAKLDGLDLQRCLAAPRLDGPVTATDGAVVLPDAQALLRHVEGQCDAVLEAVHGSSDGQPALSILESALRMEPPAHAITASKAPVALAHDRLRALASERQRRFLFESSVMDGVPIFCLLRSLPGARVQRLLGVLNSTSNLVLTRMRSQGCSLWDAVAFAQQEGIAERDPSDDLDGRDAAAKLAVLSAVCFGAAPAPAEIPADSIRNVTLQQVQDVAARGLTLKVVCEASRGADGRVNAIVALKELPWHHPLANLEGASAALTIETDVLGPITMMSTEPTTMDTAYGLLQDLQVAMLGDGCGLGR